MVSEHFLNGSERAIHFFCFPHKKAATIQEASGDDQRSCDLPGDGLHPFYAGMTVELVDVLQLDEGDGVVTADGPAGGGDGGLEFAVHDEIDGGVGVSVLQMVEHIGHGRTEGVEVCCSPVGVLVFADGRAGPAVVGAAKDDDDIRTTEIPQTGTEGTVGVVLTLIACMADGGTGERVVPAKPHPGFLEQQAPPGLLHAGDIRILMLPLEIPYGVGVGL